MRFLRHTRQVTVPGAGSTLVSMPREDRPFRELTIWGIPETPRQIGDAPVAKNFTAEVFFGPTSQSAAIFRPDDEVFLAYDPGDAVRIWPPNNQTSNPQQRGTNNQVHGFAVAVRINNAAAAPLVITVEFNAMTIDQG